MGVGVLRGGGGWRIGGLSGGAVGTQPGVHPRSRKAPTPTATGVASMARQAQALAVTRSYQQPLSTRPGPPHAILLPPAAAPCLPTTSPQQGQPPSVAPTTTASGALHQQYTCHHNPASSPLLLRHHCLPLVLVCVGIVADAHNEVGVREGKLGLFQRPGVAEVEQVKDACAARHDSTAWRPTARSKKAWAGAAAGTGQPGSVCCWQLRVDCGNHVVLCQPSGNGL